MSCLYLYVYVNDSVYFLVLHLAVILSLFIYYSIIIIIAVIIIIIIMIIILLQKCGVNQCKIEFLKFLKGY